MTAASFLGAVTLGVILVLLRIEFAVLIFFATTYIAWPALQRSLAQRSLDFPGLARGSPLLLGGAITSAAFFIYFGHFTPDTAAAKVLDGQSIATMGYLIAHAIGASFSFGVLIALSYVMAIAVALGGGAKADGELMRSSLLASLPPLVFALIIFRHQNVQAIRHVSWIFYFTTTALALATAEMRTREAGGAWLSSRLAVFAGLACTAVLAGVWWHEGSIVARISSRDRQAVEKIQQMPFAALTGRLGYSIDVGMPMYFIPGRICDGGGLINGRDSARSSMKERIRTCLAQRPEFLFLTDFQLADMLAEAEPAQFEGWSVCDSYLLDNVTTPPPELLIVSPALADRVCPKPLGRLDRLGAIMVTN